MPTILELIDANNALRLTVTELLAMLEDEYQDRDEGGWSAETAVLADVLERARAIITANLEG